MKKISVDRTAHDAGPPGSGPFSGKGLYFPALMIVVMVAGMLIFIGLSTFWNWDANRKNTLTLVRRQGATLLGALDAGLRAAMKCTDREGRSIARLFSEAGKNEEVAHIYLCEARGRILFHSDPSRAGETADWPEALHGLNGAASRMVRPASAAPIFEAARRFSPDAGRESVLVVGLRMTEYAAARRADLHHAVVMAAILAALAGAVVFFTYVIRSYYRVNTALKQAEAYTRQVIARMAGGLISTNSSGNVVSYNGHAMELLGLDETTLRADRLDRIIDLEAWGLAGAFRDGGSMMDVEVRHRLPDGTVLPLSISLTPLPAPAGTPGGVVVMIRDLREVKRLEEQVRRSEKLAAIGKLAAMVAHEIRNPLSSIRGFARFLSHGLKDRPEDQEYARIMVQEVDRINRVVTDLLTFARPADPERTPTDLAVLIDHTVRLTEADFRAAGVRMEKQTPTERVTAEIDGNQMTQVLLNLILNALQTMKPGDRLEIGAGRDPFSRTCRIWVEDEGPGIPPQIRDRIFEPFFTTREKGTGLGLAIARSIVENHQGDLFLESPPPGKSSGTRFTVSIPVTPVPLMQRSMDDPQDSCGG